MGSLGNLNRITMICSPLMAQSVDQMFVEMQQAKAQGADFVEVRLDCIENFQPLKDLQFLLVNKPLPVVISCWPKCEGGLFEGDDEQRLKLFRLAEELGADYIDIEFKLASDYLGKEKRNHRGCTKYIVSSYVNDGTPSNKDLTDLVARVHATGADIVKVVVNVTDITEISRIFELLQQSQVPVIAYSAGERGFMSQILSPKYGGFIVYGSVDGKPDPGLTSIDSLRQAYKIDDMNEDTAVFGLISKPVSHSKGPILHNPTFRHKDFNGVYVPMFVDNLKKFFSTYPDFAGFSVGFPYKEAVTEFCDEIHPLARSIGAVNTIVRRCTDGKLIGYNTDCEGAISAIEDAIKEKGCTNGKISSSSPIHGKQFVLVGAGGAGRALAFGAKIRGARVLIFDIDFNRANSLASAVSGEAKPFEDIHTFLPEKGAILANATPVGMHPSKERIPVPEESLRDYLVVFDAVYTPRETTLLKDAKAAGAITVSGVEMFLRQAVGQFKLFTGQEAPVEFMRDIVLAKF